MNIKHPGQQLIFYFDMFIEISGASRCHSFFFLGLDPHTKNIRNAHRLRCSNKVARKCLARRHSRNSCHMFVFIVVCACSRHALYFIFFGFRIHTASTRRVPGLTIRNCARIYNNLVQMGAKVSAIGVRAKKIFEPLYLVSGLGTFGLCINCPYAPTTPTVHSPIIS